MIQDSINQALGALGQLGAVGKYFKNQAAAVKTEQIKAGTEALKGQAETKFSTEDEINKLKKLKSETSTFTTAGKERAAEIDANIEMQTEHLKRVNDGMKELETGIAKKAGLKPNIIDGQQVGWKDKNKPGKLPNTNTVLAANTFRDIQAQSVARKNAMLRAQWAAENKQEQANDNFILDVKE